MSELRDGRGNILIVGGSGVVGRRIAAHVARRFPSRVIIAGRDERRALAACAEVAHGARARRIDVEDRATIGPALEGVGTVLACVAQHEPHLLRAAVARGLGYTDIAPRLAFWQGGEELASEARAQGARIVLGAGLSPGISNVMARQLSQALGRVDRIETAILLSVGDEYGPDSLRHVLEVVGHPFRVVEDDRQHDAIPFSKGARIDFPAPLGPRRAYLFPWSDVVHYPKTLGARFAFGRFGIEPAWIGDLVAVLVRSGAQRWVLNPSSRRRGGAVIHRLQRRFAGRDRFALVVTAEAGGRALRMCLSGRHQADATAAGAAEIGCAIAAGEIEHPGVWLPEQVISCDRFFDALAKLGLRCSLEEVCSTGTNVAPRARARNLKERRSRLSGMS